MSTGHNTTSKSKASENVASFDDLVIRVAGDIFAEALGRSVANTLLHNFLIRDPSLLHGGNNRLTIFQRLLQESFGDFHANILGIVLEQVCLLSGIDHSSLADKPISELLAETEAAYRSIHAQTRQSEAT